MLIDSCYHLQLSTLGQARNVQELMYLGVAFNQGQRGLEDKYFKFLTNSWDNSETCSVEFHRTPLKYWQQFPAGVIDSVMHLCWLPSMAPFSIPTPLLSFLEAPPRCTVGIQIIASGSASRGIQFIAS